MASGLYRTYNDKIGKDPQQAINYVTKEQEHRVKQSLVDGLYYTETGDKYTVVKPDPNKLAEAWDWAHPDLSNVKRWGQRIALLMSGTTGELADMLKDARGDGIEAFWSTGDSLVVWYLRRGAGKYTKSLVLVAPKLNFLQVALDDPRKNTGYPRDGWKFMGASINHNSPGYHGLGLRWLTDIICEKGEGETAWR